MTLIQNEHMSKILFSSLINAGTNKILKWKSLSRVRVFATPRTIYTPRNSPSQNTGVGSRSLLQRIFPTQGSNPGLLYRGQILYCLSHQGSPSMPSFPVLHYLPEFAQIHVQWVSDAIQPSHPLSPTSLLAFSLSQHQGLLRWASSSHQVARILKFQL